MIRTSCLLSFLVTRARASCRPHLTVPCARWQASSPLSYCALATSFTIHPPSYDAAHLAGKAARGAELAIINMLGPAGEGEAHAQATGCGRAQVARSHDHALMQHHPPTHPSPVSSLRERSGNINTITTTSTLARMDQGARTRVDMTGKAGRPTALDMSSTHCLLICSHYKLTILISNSRTSNASCRYCRGRAVKASLSVSELDEKDHIRNQTQDRATRVRGAQTRPTHVGEWRRRERIHQRLGALRTMSLQLPTKRGTHTAGRTCRNSRGDGPLRLEQCRVLQRRSHPSLLLDALPAVIVPAVADVVALLT